MSAGLYNIVIEQGATFGEVYGYENPDGSPIVLTDCTARLHIRKTKESEDAILILTTENGGITIDEEAGTVAVSISATDTANLNFSSAFYDLEVVFPTGWVDRIIEGRVLLSRETTHG